MFTKVSVNGNLEKRLHFVCALSSTVFSLLPRRIHCIYLKARDHESANHVFSYITPNDVQFFVSLLYTQQVTSPVTVDKGPRYYSSHKVSALQHLRSMYNTSEPS